MANKEEQAITCITGSAVIGGASIIGLTFVGPIGWVILISTSGASLGIAISALQQGLNPQ